MPENNIQNPGFYERPGKFEIASFEYVSGQIDRIDTLIKDTTLATQRWLQHRPEDADDIIHTVTSEIDNTTIVTGPNPVEWEGYGYDSDKKWSYLYRNSKSDITYQWVYTDPFGKDEDPDNNNAGQWQLYSVNKDFIDKDDYANNIGIAYETQPIKTVSGYIDDVYQDIWKPGGIEERVTDLEDEKLDRITTMNDGNSNNEIGVITTNKGDKFVMASSTDNIGAEVGITESAAVAMSTTENGAMTMFGTYSSKDAEDPNIGDIKAQITARDSDNVGTRMLFTTDKVYYTKGLKNNKKNDNDEVLVLKDISGKLDKNKDFTDGDNTTKHVKTTEDQFVLRTSREDTGIKVGAEVGITNTGASAMSTTEYLDAGEKLTMFGTYTSKEMSSTTDAKDIRAQITTRDELNNGTRILVAQDKIYYTKDKATNEHSEKDELLVVSDISGKLDINTTMNNDEYTNIIGVLNTPTGDRFVMNSSGPNIGAEVGITETGAAAMSTTDTDGFTMFGTYGIHDDNGDIRAQVTARKEDKKTGSRILLTTDNAYYTKGKTDNNITLDDEILVKSDISGKLDISSKMGTDLNNKIGIISDKFIMHTFSDDNSLKAEVGTTETGAIAMSTVENDEMTMFGTYSSRDANNLGPNNVDIKAQITTRDSDNIGTRMLFAKDKVYYTKGKDVNDHTSNDELLVVSDISGKLDKNSVMNSTANNVAGVVSGPNGDKFILASTNGDIAAEVGITETGAVAMSTNTTVGGRVDMTMFGTYGPNDGDIYNISGIRAQITAREDSVGTRILVTKEKAYYSGNAESNDFVNDDTKEIAVKGDLEKLNTAVFEENGLVDNINKYAIEHGVTVNAWGDNTYIGDPHNSSNLEDRRVLLQDHKWGNLIHKLPGENLNIPNEIKQHANVEGPYPEYSEESKDEELLAHPMCFIDLDTGKYRVAFKTYNDSDKENVLNWLNVYNKAYIDNLMNPISTTIANISENLNDAVSSIGEVGLQDTILDNIDKLQTNTVNISGVVYGLAEDGSDGLINKTTELETTVNNDKNIINKLLNKISMLEQNITDQISVMTSSIPTIWRDEKPEVTAFEEADPLTLITKTDYSQSELNTVGNQAAGNITKYVEIDEALTPDTWIAVKLNGNIGTYTVPGTEIKRTAVVVNYVDVTDPTDGSYGYIIANKTRFKMPLPFLSKDSNNNWQPIEELQGAKIEVLIMSGAAGESTETIEKTIFAGYLPTIKIV